MTIAKGPACPQCKHGGHFGLCSHRDTEGLRDCVCGMSIEWLRAQQLGWPRESLR